MADEAGGIGALRARLLRDKGLQFDFAGPPPPPVPHEPPWLRPLLDFLNAIGRALQPLMGPGLSLVKVAFSLGVAALAALLVWVLVREIAKADFTRRRREREGRAPPTDFAPDPVKARALLENADRLAAQGRFDMAVRLILHRGVEDIEARRPRLVRPALTARDIAALEGVPAAARAAFARIAAVVEFSAFAGQPIGRPAFDQCRAAYEAFVQPGAWR